MQSKDNRPTVFARPRDVVLCAPELTTLDKVLDPSRDAFRPPRALHMLLSYLPRARLRRAGYARLVPLLGDPSPPMPLQSPGWCGCCALLRALVAQCVARCAWLCNWGVPARAAPESPAQPRTSGVSIRHDLESSHEPPQAVALPSQKREDCEKKGEAAFLLGSPQEGEKDVSSHGRIECPICLVRQSLMMLGVERTAV